MQLLVGQQAPDFAVGDLYGNRVALEDYRGVCLLLSFYRFAVCPVCNIRMWRLSQQVESYRRRGLYFIACIESSAENTHFYLDRLKYPFPMIPDLGGQLYETYGLKSSPLRVLKGMAVHADMYVEAQRRNLGGWNIFRFDGDFGRLPADFLIGPVGRVLLAYYGRDHGDFLPLEQLDLYLRATPPVQPLPAPLYNGRPLPPTRASAGEGSPRRGRAVDQASPTGQDLTEIPTQRLPPPAPSGEVGEPHGGWK
ncbi:MAG: redoxin domain-containing protein [Ktedonobacterales bacterium]